MGGGEQCLRTQKTMSREKVYLLGNSQLKAFTRRIIKRAGASQAPKRQENPRQPGEQRRSGWVLKEAADR